jgi:hypothetical protein
MYNLVNETRAAAIQTHEEKYGRPNDFPPGWEEITPEEFARSNFFVFGFLKTEYRQMFRHSDGTKEKRFTAAMLFFHDRGSFAISSRDGLPIYFRFGCKHEWGSARDELKRRGLRLESSEHARFCVKCKALEIDDSSD